MESMAHINSSALPISPKSAPAETPAAGTHQPSSPARPVVVSYKECRRNHAAAYGFYAIDGCCEFMPSGPAWLICAACSCHRSFHRRYERLVGSASPEPLSPTPLSVRYPPKDVDADDAMQAPEATSFQPERRKRFRTKFTPQQKEMMHEFAEEVGWKLRRVDVDKVVNFCNQVGVEKRVLKVWMHNNKYTLGAKMAAGLNDNPTGDIAGINSGSSGGVDASDGDKKSSPSSGGTDE